VSNQFSFEQYDKFPDRQVEKEEFLKLIQFGEKARLLAIRDRAGTGKSHLLRWIKYHCEWTASIAASLIDLDPKETTASGFAIASTFELVARIRQDLELSQPGVTAPRFDTLYKALKMRNLTAFGTLPPTYTGNLNMQGASSSGTNNTFAALSVATQQFNINPSVGDWSVEQEEFAKQECVTAFLNDLKTIADARPLVLLLDSLDERCDSKLADWVTKKLILPLSIEESRPPSLVLVVAGRQLGFIDSLKLRLGASTYEERVRSRESLGRWEEVHVKAFLHYNGYGDLAEDDVAFVWSKVKQDMPIRAALKIADALRAARD